MMGMKIYLDFLQMTIALLKGICYNKCNFSYSYDAKSCDEAACKIVSCIQRTTAVGWELSCRDLSGISLRSWVLMPRTVRYPAESRFHIGIWVVPRSFAEPRPCLMGWGFFIL